MKCRSHTKQFQKSLLLYYVIFFILLIFHYFNPLYEKEISLLFYVWILWNLLYSNIDQNKSLCDYICSKFKEGNLNGRKTLKSFAFENSYQDIYIFLEIYGCQNMKLFQEKMHLSGYIYISLKVFGRGFVITALLCMCLLYLTTV